MAEIREKWNDALNYIRKNKILDATAKTLLSEIPVGGLILKELYQNIGINDTQKIEEIILFLERYSGKNEKELNLILGMVNSNKEDLTKGNVMLKDVSNDINTIISILEEIREELPTIKEIEDVVRNADRAPTLKGIQDVYREKLYASDKERKEILQKELEVEQWPWRNIDGLTRVIGFDNKKEEYKEKCRELLLEIGAKRSIRDKEMWGLKSRVGTSG